MTSRMESSPGTPGVARFYATRQFGDPQLNLLVAPGNFREKKKLDCVYEEILLFLINGRKKKRSRFGAILPITKRPS